MLYFEAMTNKRYIVKALSRQATLAYTAEAVSEAEIKQQQTAFTALVQSLSPDVIKHMQARLADLL